MCGQSVRALRPASLPHHRRRCSGTQACMQRHTQRKRLSPPHTVRRGRRSSTRASLATAHRPRLASYMLIGQGARRRKDPRQGHSACLPILWLRQHSLPQQDRRARVSTIDTSPGRPPFALTSPDDGRCWPMPKMPHGGGLCWWGATGRGRRRGRGRRCVKDGGGPPQAVQGADMHREQPRRPQSLQPRTRDASRSHIAMTRAQGHSARRT